VNRIHAYLIFANCLIIGLFTNADAQRIIGTFSGKKNYIPHYTKWFLSGDSLLVTFEDRRSLAENTQAFFYISASKTSNISELKKALHLFSLVSKIMA